MTLSSRHMIRNSSPGGLRPSTPPLGHGGSPQYRVLHVDGEETFCFFQTADTGNRTPNFSVKGSGANHHPRAPSQMLTCKLPSKHKTFVQHLYNVGPTSSTLVHHCTNITQMFCVCWVSRSTTFIRSPINIEPESMPTVDSLLKWLMNILHDWPLETLSVYTSSVCTLMTSQGSDAVTSIFKCNSSNTSKSLRLLKMA